MKDLIEALQIFLKYGNENFPVTCEHDVLYVHGYPIENLSGDDIKRLGDLGFHWSETYKHWYLFC